jgi:microcystin-dependent protein
MSEPFLGQIALFGFSFAPVKWATCQGQILPISQYTALFSLLGTNFGGNGTSNFQLPNLQGRVAVGMGTQPGGSTYDIGEEGGSESVQLTTGTMPRHTHSLSATTALGKTNTPANNTVLAQVAEGTVANRNRGNIYNTGNTNSTLALTTIGTAGGGLAHNNVQPSLALNYCIALEGVFPSRG